MSDSIWINCQAKSQTVHLPPRVGRVEELCGLPVQGGPDPHHDPAGGEEGQEEEAQHVGAGPLLDRAWILGQMVGVE